MAFTYFFRDLQTFELLVEYALPDLKRRRYISVWDAGCAMGPEPYTLAIILRENMGQFLFRNVKIHATDIDESGHFGSIIEKGVYPEGEVKRIPEDLLSRYFTPSDPPGHYQIVDEIRNAVAFQWHDLLSLQPVREGLGLIVCKNVLLHFSPAERVEVFKVFHRALSEDGYLVTEQTQKMPSEVEHLFRQITNAGQVYQKVQAAA